MDAICRVCMKNEPDMVPLFHEGNGDLSAGHMISACTIYEAKQFDEMPQQICARCLTALHQAYSLKLLCEQSHRQLLEIQGKLVNSSKGTGEEKSTQTESFSIHPCERCDEKFFSFQELQQHRVAEHKGSPMVCRFCEKSFNRIGYLKTHIAIFHPDAGYTSHVQCHLCDKRFTRVAHMRRHLSIMHKQEEGDDENIEEVSEEEPAEASKDSAEVGVDIRTSFSEEKDTSQFEVRTHDGGFVEVLFNESDMNSVEYTAEDIMDDSLISSAALPVKLCPPNETELVETADVPASEDSCKEETNDSFINSEKSHSCHICHKNFTTNTYLQRHLAIHKRKRYECKECSVSCLTKVELKQHMKAEGHDKPLLCPECGLRCKTSNILMIHMRRHNGEKPYKCRFCSKAFPRMDDVRVHEKYHTNEKSHFCETCGKGFQRKYNLTIHRRVHTGEKPYKCSQCPQAFAQVNDLKIHIRRHTGERFACEECGASFLQGFQVRQHKLKEHGIEEVAPTQRVTKFTSPEEQAKQIQQNLEKESLEEDIES